MISYSGKDKYSVNYLKTIYFDYPEYTMASVGFLPATWIKHRGALEELVLAHPRVFPGFVKGSVDFDFKVGMWSPLYELGRHTDCWGVTWNNIHRGLDSQVEVEPLSDWSAFSEWKKHRPDPMKDGYFGPRDWGIIEASIKHIKASGQLPSEWALEHGFFFMRLYYLRGFENLLVDLALGEPRLLELIKIVCDFDTAMVAKHVELGMEKIAMGEDLGMQTSLPISPAMWREFVKPSYRKIMAPARDRGIPIFLHSDGHILEIIPDLIECGVTCLNPQFRANGLAGLVEVARGKVALCQDLDRQMFPFATPGQIQEHVGEVYEALHLEEGGLFLQAECGPDVPLQNIDAICTAMERLCNLPEPSKM
jgi:hypothetical protein